ncbi:hypothetical protein [Curtobacterium sp. MCBA15_008]|uniref:hypothetical protein n=1 Tax=Curtobacterium sp. MCBA15_008 TaxID=1898736 RepID=UPI0011141776|nr:hypothetical protein [Curtobacterium sp. MCBA15_008]
MRIELHGGGFAHVEASSIEIDGDELVFVADHGEDMARHPIRLVSRVVLPDDASGQVDDRAYSVEAIRQDHPQAYARWESADESALLAMADAGMTPDEIGRILGRQPGGISSRLAKLRGVGSDASTQVRFG